VRVHALLPFRQNCLVMFVEMIALELGTTSVMCSTWDVPAAVRPASIAKPAGREPAILIIPAPRLYLGKHSDENSRRYCGASERLGQSRAVKELKTTQVIGLMVDM
jgi:hypothetical protein